MTQSGHPFQRPGFLQLPLISAEYLETRRQMTISKSPLSTQVFVLRCLGWISVATIAMLSLVPGNDRPHVLSTGQLDGQLEHFVAYAGTAALLAAGYTAKRQLIGISVLLPVYAACLEILQIFVPGRNAQIIDAAGGTIGSWFGIVLVLSVHYWYWKRKVAAD